MRIVSQFRDYYDSVQAMGQDQGLLYVRNETAVDLNHRWQWHCVNFINNKPWSFTHHVIGFCNKVHACLANWTPAGKNAQGEDLYEQVFCYSVEDVDVLAARLLTKKALNVYFEPRSKNRYGYGEGVRRYRVEDFFAKFALKADSYVNLFEDSKAPVFVATLRGYVDRLGRVNAPRSDRSPKIVYNACLGDYGFMRIKDTYTAFQEITAFVSNVALPIKPIPSISDEIMAEIKGFNKFSFRKDPSPK